MLPTVVADIFGMRHFGTLLGLMNVAPAASSFIFSAYFTSSLYESQLQPGETVSCSIHATFQVCFGLKCFELALQIMGGIAALSCLLIVLLWFMNRDVYRPDPASPTAP